MKKLFVLVLSLCLVSFAFANVDKAAVEEAFAAQKAGLELTKAQDSVLSEFYGNGGGNAIDNFGGPDAGGYSWRDSEEAGGPTFNWYDITGTGTSFIADMGDDTQSGPYPIGFGFTFYGTTFTDVYIGSNGALNFDDLYISLGNVALPNLTHGAQIAIFNDDLDPVGGAADAYYETFNDGTQNVFVISCINWYEYPDGGFAITMQYQLYEDGTIQFHYQTVDAGFDIAGGTIGIQDPTRTIGLMALYNGDIVGYPYDGLAIEFSQAETDASLSGYVYDSTDDTPLVDATVTLGGMTTTTDGTGFYDFPDVFSGDYAWTANAAGYIGDGGNITIAVGANTLDIWLDPFMAVGDVLIVDVDPTPDSGPAIDAILQGLGYTTVYVTDFLQLPFTDYEYVFVFTGIYPDYFAIATGSAEETACVDYLNANGNLYLEGGDLFGFLPPTNLLAMLQLTGIADGSSDLLNVLGEANLTGLDLAYAGENNYIDHIEPSGDAVRILYNPADGAGCGVIDNSLVYHTACMSFELGMLVDSVDWTRADIVSLIMAAFDSGVEPSPVNLYLTGTSTMIPPGGGNVVYDAHLVSDLPNAFAGVHYQTFVTLPNTQVIGPLMDIPFTLAPFMDHTVTGMTLAIPDYAPQGGYTFEGRVGYPGTAYIVSDDFGFAKVGDGLFETFDVDPAPGFVWEYGDLGSFMIDGGYAKFDMTLETDDWGSGAYTGDTFSDFSQSSTFEFIQTAGYSVGMLFRGTGVQDATYSGYAVYFSNGSYSAWEYTAGTATNLIGWTADASINQGVGAINTLQIDFAGDTFDISNNGTYITSFTDATHASGFPGVATAYSNETWFDDLVCSHAAAALVAGPNEPGQLETVLRDDMGKVITNPDDFYTPGVGFDRSAEFASNSFEFIPEDWVSSGSFITGEEAGVVALPTDFEMTTAYPNPFNPSTSVAIALPSASDLTVTVFNVMGQQVATLANGKYNAGQHNFVFDAAKLASGLYFIQAQVPGELNAIQKVTLMK